MDFIDMAWDDIQGEIASALVIGVDFVTEDMMNILVDKLGFTNPEAYALIEKLGDECFDLEDEIADELANDKLEEWVKLKRNQEKKNYPEDNPDQILLFDPTEYNKE